MRPVAGLGRMRGMSQRGVVITGLGPVSGLGLGIESTWGRAVRGEGAIGPIKAFDPSGFDSTLASEVEDFKIRDFVPKSYRKATKVMARDIELTVTAADLAARDAGVATKGTSPDEEPSYASSRMGAHIGAGLIAVDLDELTAALVEAKDEGGNFDLHKWGSEGMQNLTPLWLLKYLPNMLACHVTIIHDTHGPSNTITCAEASSGLSIGESLRVIQRGAADLCFCGGVESKLNPMAFLRQQLTGRLTTATDEAGAVRPLDKAASGCVVGEGGGIVTLEAVDTFSARRNNSQGARAYAQLLGFGASQSVNLESGNRSPEVDGRGISVAIRAALRDAGIDAEQIDLVVPFGCGVPAWDAAEAAALERIFAGRLSDLPVLSVKALVGNLGAGAGGLDLCIAAKALHEQAWPAIINRDKPIGQVPAGRAAGKGQLHYALCCSSGFGGQNTALVLKRYED